MKHKSLKVLLVLLIPWLVAEFGPFELFRSALASHLTTTHSFDGPTASVPDAIQAPLEVRSLTVLRTDWRGETEITTRLSDAEGTERVAHARIETFDLSGPYWAPFWKTGSCRCVVVVTDDAGPDEIRIEGTMELSVRGLCSTATYRKLLREALNEKIEAGMRKLGER